LWETERRICAQFLENRVNRKLRGSLGEIGESNRERLGAPIGNGGHRPTTRVEPGPLLAGQLSGVRPDATLE
jgi:hypothetical protein